MLSGGRAGEGENVFGQESMTGVAISVFVKNPDAVEQSRILFHDIGDDLDRKQKLDIVRRFGSVRGIEETRRWSRITPDDYGDWLDQRDSTFEEHLKIGEKRSEAADVLFASFSSGVITGRDAWCVNPSRTALAFNIESTLSYYNQEMARWQTDNDAAHSEGNDLGQIDEFVDTDPKKISWSFSLKADFRRGKPLTSQDGHFVPCLYRPFTKQWLFCSRRFNHSVYQTPRIFPDAELPNRVIAVSGTGARAGFSALMMDVLPNLHTIDSGQCFPFWLYEADEDTQADLLGEQIPGFRRLDAITDYSLRCFRDAYPSESVSREDVFRYVYGLLHSEDYRNRFSANLAKVLPRIPCVKPVEDYRAFRDAGRRLGELHVGFEDVNPFPATIDTGGKLLMEDPEAAYRVTRMKHPGTGRNKDLSMVIYNDHITIRDVPGAAWDYIVNGKPALAWVMDRQRVRTDKASGIVSDANRYAIETVGDPRYPLDLFLRVITVSLETMKIVRALPELVIEQTG